MWFKAEDSCINSDSRNSATTKVHRRISSRAYAADTRRGQIVDSPSKPLRITLRVLPQKTESVMTYVLYWPHDGGEALRGNDESGKSGCTLHRGRTSGDGGLASSTRPLPTSHPRSPQPVAVQGHERLSGEVSTVKTSVLSPSKFIHAGTTCFDNGSFTFPAHPKYLVLTPVLRVHSSEHSACRTERQDKKLVPNVPDVNMSWPGRSSQGTNTPNLARRSYWSWSRRSYGEREALAGRRATPFRVDVMREGGLSFLGNAGCPSYAANLVQN
ncbi:hypothetical protein Bbelb_043320 [Branchiostoma belcheri]|nr:hypothetical protein Bbelb_043320 [Branchiostoma belcheri]